MPTYVTENAPVKGVVAKKRYFDITGKELPQRPSEGIIVNKSYPGTVRPYEALWLVKLDVSGSGAVKRVTRAETVEEAVKNLVKVIEAVLSPVEVQTPETRKIAKSGKITYHGKTKEIVRDD